MKVSSYKELEVWRKGIEIVKRIYALTRGFPKEEAYGLVSQLRRAAVSVPSNIAEGFARANTREYRQFCHVAKGSCAERSGASGGAYRARVAERAKEKTTP